MSRKPPGVIWTLSRSGSRVTMHAFVMFRKFAPCCNPISWWSWGKTVTSTAMSLQFSHDDDENDEPGQNYGARLKMTFLCPPGSATAICQLIVERGWFNQSRALSFLFCFSPQTKAQQLQFHPSLYAIYVQHMYLPLHLVVGLQFNDDRWRWRRSFVRFE